MTRVTTFGQLEGMASRLFVEAICPKCGTILISTMPEAQMVLVFGCINCADIDTSALLSFNSFPINNTLAEEIAATPIS